METGRVRARRSAQCCVEQQRLRPFFYGGHETAGTPARANTVRQPAKERVGDNPRPTKSAPQAPQPPAHAAGGAGEGRNWAEAAETEGLAAAPATPTGPLAPLIRLRSRSACTRVPTEGGERKTERSAETPPLARACHAVPPPAQVACVARVSTYTGQVPPRKKGWGAATPSPGGHTHAAPAFPGGVGERASTIGGGGQMEPPPHPPTLDRVALTTTT